MLANISKTDVQKLADKYQLDIEQVVDLLDEGFTLEEAEEIIYEAEM